MISQISMISRNTDCDKTICGFTLVELLLVLVLIAITMAAITPRLGRNIPFWQAREEAKNILAVVRLARQAAVRRQEVIVFVADPNNGSFAVENINGSINSSDVTKNFLVPRQFLGKGVKLAQLEGFELIGNQQGLVFWPDGRAKAARIELTADKGSESSKWHILIEDDGSAVLQEVFGNE